MNCAIMVLTVRLARSVGLSWGEYGAVYCNSHPSSRIYSLKARLVNYVPFSHTNVRGTPKCPRIRSRNALIRVAVVDLLSGMSSTHLANASKKSNNIVLPDFYFGKGPTKSARHVEQGSSIWRDSICPAGFCWSTLNLWQDRQSWTYLFASRYIPGQ